MSICEECNVIVFYTGHTGLIKLIKHVKSTKLFSGMLWISINHEHGKLSFEFGHHPPYNYLALFKLKADASELSSRRGSDGLGKLCMS